MAIQEPPKGNRAVNAVVTAALSPLALWKMVWRGCLADLFRHPILVLAVVTIFGILFFDLGKPLGVPFLFWHDEIAYRFVAGLSVVGLLADVLLVGYVLRHRETTPYRDLQLACLRLQAAMWHPPWWWFALW